MGHREYLIRINYKSGIQEEIWVEEFSLKERRGELTQVEWLGAGKSKRIHFIGVDNIESIYRIKSRWRLF